MKTTTIPLSNGVLFPGREQGEWLSTDLYKPKPGAYEFIEVSYLDDPENEKSRIYDVYFHDGYSWGNCTSGHRREFDYWRPLQEID